MTKKAFDGIKILDFTWVGVGPITIKYLADWGADVIHVQSHNRPCTLSMSMPFKGPFPKLDNAWWTAEYNTSKYSITLNLEKPESLDIIKRLITDWQPDIIAEAFTPKAMKKWGLDYDKVKEIKPDIIYYSTCQQGQYGPHAMYPGYGNLSASLAGAYHLTGWPDRGPAPPYGAYTDFINPRYSSATLIAALDYKRRTGKGVYLDQSQFECALHFFAPLLMDYGVTGRIANREGNRIGYAAPHGVFRCKGDERWIAIAVFNDEEWHSLCKILDHTEWIQDPRFATLKARKENEDELESLIEQTTIEFSAEQLETKIQEAGVPASVVQSTKDLFDDPQLKHRGHFRQLNHTEMGPTNFDGPCYRLSKISDNQWAPATYGEHTLYVLKDILGMTDDEISDYYANGTITTINDFYNTLPPDVRKAIGIE